MSQITALDLSAPTVADRNATVLNAFAQLPAGDSAEWTQSDDPASLHNTLMAQWPGQFAWTRQDQDGERWTLRLTRKPAGKSCCGCCGG